jgi:hypothetical protein
MQKDGQSNRQTNMTKVIIAFCNFANVPKNCLWFHTRKQEKVGKMNIHTAILQRREARFRPGIWTLRGRRTTVQKGIYPSCGGEEDGIHLLVTEMYGNTKMERKATEQ